MCEASSQGNHDTQAASCHPMVDYGILSCLTPLLCMCLSEGFIVCSKNEGKRVCKPGLAFSHWVLGFCWAAVTFYKAIDPKNEYCGELQPGLYFPDAHLLSVADGLLQGSEMSF